MALLGPDDKALLGPDDMALLARIDFVHRRLHSGVNPGERRSPRSARSAEFADFRPYSMGDDLRQVDWRAYARFDRLVLRLYVAEEEAALNVVVDASESMNLGSPPKWQTARRLAAALAVIGLGRMDRVAAGVLHRAGPHTQHVRRAVGAGRILRFLADIRPGGAAGPDDLMGLRWLRPGITVVISDFLVEDRWDSALAALRHARQEVVLWQLLAPDEERPDLSGDLKLKDVELGRRSDYTITPRVVREYVAALAEHRDGLRRQAAAANGRFLHTTSADDLQASVFAAMRAGVATRA